jgi:2'-hydroxyisoflavone reductase
VLAPGGPEHPCQFIDVRDLAAWIVHGAECRLAGTFNATGQPRTLGAFLARCQAVITASSSELVWIDDETLIAAGVNRWMGVPLWITEPGWEAASDVSIDKALSAGLRFRSLDHTIADTLAWDLARGGPPQGHEGLSEDDERRLLIACGS